MLQCCERCALIDGMQTQEFPKALTQDAASALPSAAYSLRLPVPTHLPTQGQGEGTHLAPAQAGD